MRALDNKRIKLVMLIIIGIIINITSIVCVNFIGKREITISYTINASDTDNYQIFYDLGDGWKEENSTWYNYITPNEEYTIRTSLPRGLEKVRLDLGDKVGDVQISDISLQYLWKTIKIDTKILIDKTAKNDINSMEVVPEGIYILKAGEDAFLVIDSNELHLDKLLILDAYINIILKIFGCIIINMTLYILVRKRRCIKQLAGELYGNKTLLWNLSKSDFKTRYAGSYLGITWAFIQPIVTVLVYWFVFQVGFRSAPIDNFPFVLWLVAGLVPWFFFSEALMNATNSMIEYSYLVKKVVFKISILPIVKIISALFVHLFFIAFTLFIYNLYGYRVDVYTLQVLYYTMCMFVFVLGISYATSAIIIFFRDLGQIINIILQIGMWMTPIMWSYTMVPNKYEWVLKLNPMYYIVEGYRDSLINKVWFWERFNQTAYFWAISIALFVIGSIVFKRLKVHFADVL